MAKLTWCLLVLAAAALVAGEADPGHHYGKGYYRRPTYYGQRRPYSSSGSFGHGTGGRSSVGIGSIGHLGGKKGVHSVGHLGGKLGGHSTLGHGFIGKGTAGHLGTHSTLGHGVGKGSVGHLGGHSTLGHGVGKASVGHLGGKLGGHGGSVGHLGGHGVKPYHH